EATAFAAAAGPWEADGHEVLGEVHDSPIVDYIYEPDTAAHIARHDPKRVLAECAALRAIIERNAELARIEVRRQARNLAGDTLARPAPVYADPPDCREERTPCPARLTAPPTGEGPSPSTGGGIRGTRAGRRVNRDRGACGHPDSIVSMQAAIYARIS